VQDPETSWILQAQQGNSDAFAYLVEKYQRPVFNLCYRMLGNSEDAEDAAQETFLRSYHSIRRYDRNRSFGTWLLSIAAHYSIDQLRRRRYPIVSLDDLPVSDIPEKAPGIEDRLSDKETRERIRALLDILDPVDRAVVVLYYWYDLPYDEISEILSLTISALKSRLHRARRAMAAEWGNKNPEIAQQERMQHETSTI